MCYNSFMKQQVKNRILGITLGILTSFAAVGLWVLFDYINFLSGLAGALIGLSFIFIYRRFNREEVSYFPYTFGAILIFVEVGGAELITMGIRAASQGIVLWDSFASKEFVLDFSLNLGIGYLMSYLMYFLYTFRQLRIIKLQKSGYERDFGSKKQRNKRIKPKDDENVIDMTNDDDIQFH